MKIANEWEQFKSELKKTWSKLTDDEISQYHLNHEVFLRALETKYGLDRTQAEKRLKEIERKCNYSAAA